MLAEVQPTLYSIRVAGRVIASNIPSRQLAEAQLFTLPADQRALAEIVPVTQDGRSILLG